MNELKLRSYFVESFRGSFPSFPAKREGEKVKESLSVNLSVYKNKKNDINFALKLNLKITAKKINSRKPRIYFEATMVGLFIRSNESIPFKLLAKTIAKDMLYEKMHLIFSNVLKNSPIEKFKMPLRLKQPR